MSFNFKNAKELLELAFNQVLFDDEDLLPYQWTPSHGSDFVVIVGENASGKSLFRRLLSTIAHKTKTETMAISMEGRKTMYGPASAFVYGDESYDATSKNSAQTVLAGIRTCEKRDSSHIIIWDEPDIGLSESWAKSMGITFKAFAENLPQNTLSAVVITHSKPLLRKLLKVDHHFIYLGSQKIISLEEWLKFSPKVLPLEELSKICNERYRKIHKVLEKY